MDPMGKDKWSKSVFLLQDVSQVGNLHHLWFFFVDFPRLHGGEDACC